MSFVSVCRLPYPVSIILTYPGTQPGRVPMLNSAFHIVNCQSSQHNTFFMIAPSSKSLGVGPKWLPEPADLRNTISMVFPQRNYTQGRHKHAAWRLHAVPPPEMPSVGASGWQLIDRRDWEQDDPAFAAKQASRLPVNPSPPLSLPCF